MKQGMLAGLIAGLSVLPASAAERLAPLSKTAQAITGPIVLDQNRITMAGRATLKLMPAGTAVPFDGGFGVRQVEADIYRILTPRDPRLLNGNRLCGTGKPLTYLLVWHEKGITGPVVTIAISTSPKAPATMDDVCGTFSFVHR